MPATDAQIATLQSGRATAGADYAVKALALANAWIELHAHDTALSGRNPSVKTFVEEFRGVPAHSDYQVQAQPVLGIGQRSRERMEVLARTPSNEAGWVTLEGNRATAGADYATKAAALVAAHIELAAYDRAVGGAAVSRNTGTWSPPTGGLQTGQGISANPGRSAGAPPPTFSEWPDGINQHAVYLKTNPCPGNINEQIETRTRQLTAGF